MTTSGPGPEPEIGELTRRAGEQFALGRFEEAGALYEAALARAPERLDVALRMAQLALLDDRLADARRHAERAVERAPDQPRPLELLAEAAYRGGDYPRAAGCYDDLHRPGLAGKARRLAETGAYHRLPRAGHAHLPYLASGALPVIAARVDGRDVHLLVDTAAGELLVDRKSPGASRIPLGGTERIAFAGGRTADVEHGIVGALELGGLSLAQVPCQMLELTSVLAPYLDLPIHGVLGLDVLRRFTTTLDFRARALRLAWPGPGAPPSGGGQRMWIASGQYLVTAARVGDEELRAVVLIDTGMSGVDCLMSRSVAEGAATSRRPDGGLAGQGGGGAVEGRRVRVSRVRVGELCRTEVRAAVLARFALSWQLGFQVSALLASDFFRGAALTLDFERMALAP